MRTMLSGTAIPIHGLASNGGRIPAKAMANFSGKERQASSAGRSNLLKGPPTSRGGGSQKAQDIAKALKSSHVGP